MTTEIFRLINITSHNPKTTELNGISLNLLKGEIIGIHSQSASQRSAVLDVICGQLPPSSGSLFLYGKHLTQYGNIRNALPKFTRIDNHSMLIADLSVWENLMFYGRERHTVFFRKQLLQQYVAQLLEEFGFPPCSQTAYNQLPTVYQYALQILKVWDCGSTLLILDDCLPKLSTEEYTFLYRFFHKLLDQGVSFIISSRYLSRLSKLCDRIYFVDQHRTCKETIVGAPTGGISLPVRCGGYNSFLQHPNYLGCIDKEIFPSVKLHIPFLKGKNIAIIDTTKSLSSICAAKSRRELHRHITAGIPFASERLSSQNNKPLIAEYGLHGYVSERLSPIDNICLGISRQFSFFAFPKPNTMRYLNRAFSEWCKKNDIPPYVSGRKYSPDQEVAIVLYKLHLTNPNLLLFHYNGVASTVDPIGSLVATEFSTHKENGMAICTICTNIEHIPFFADYFILITPEGIYYNVCPDYLQQITSM